VTVLMAVLAQATHDMVPPDALTVGAFSLFFTSVFFFFFFLAFCGGNLDDEKIDI
jgi:hypothetical protein